MTNTPLLQLMHDAHNPVNGIKGLVSVLRLLHNEEETIIALDMIEANARELTKVLDNFYKTSK